MGNAPYLIDAYNKDNSPLMAPTRISKLMPSIAVLSPENKTYETSGIPLTFTANEAVSQITYSLDGEETIPLTRNTTLTGLANGDHNLTIWGNDETGNFAASQTIYFSVKVPFPTALAATASSTLIALITLGLVYLKKRKH